MTEPEKRVQSCCLFGSLAALSLLVELVAKAINPPADRQDGGPLVEGEHRAERHRAIHNVASEFDWIVDHHRFPANAS